MRRRGRASFSTNVAVQTIVCKVGEENVMVVSEIGCHPVETIGSSDLLTAFQTIKRKGGNWLKLQIVCTWLEMSRGLLAGIKGSSKIQFS